MAYGTLSVSDLQAANNQTLAQIGETLAFEAIDAALVAHRILLRQKFDPFVDVTTDRLRRYGGPDQMVMQPLDEFGRLDAQKVNVGSNVGFPLERVGVALQWTRDFFENAMGSELAEQFVAGTDADVRGLDLAIRNALFTPTNLTVTDRLVDNVTLPVKALLNADGAPVPIGPNGETFVAATHTHYLGTSSLVAADVSALIKTVTEHFGAGTCVLAINQAQEAAIRAMTANFTAYMDSRLIIADTLTYAAGVLDQINFNNRDIGIFDAATVTVRPWVQSGYIAAYMVSGKKPLVLREKRTGSFGLTLAFDNEMFPLRARGMVNTYGIGVWNRHAAAVLDTAHSTYTAPTLT